MKLGLPVEICDGTKKIRRLGISRLVTSQHKQKGVLMMGLLETCRGYRDKITGIHVVECKWVIGSGDSRQN